MVASSDKTITFTDIPACTIDGNEFTRRLNLGGAGNSTARHLWFNVTGNCTISVYLASSSTDTRTMNIDKGSFGTNIASLSAASSASKQTYSYSGGATKIYLYSTNKNIYVYGIDVAYSATGIETAQTKNAAQKVLRNGQILILRDGKTYNVLGLNQ
jgi:hypothetical protein